MTPLRLSSTRLDHSLLHLGQRLVPLEEREEWLRSWRAEFWYMHSQGQRRGLGWGLLRDALWLRTNRWQVALSGTAALSLTLLATLVGLAMLPILIFAGGWHEFAELLRYELPRFAIASTLILCVSCANGGGSMHRSPSGSLLRWFRASVFFTLQVALLLVLSFLLSTDLTLHLEVRGFFAAMPLQLLAFVILALLGIRWSLLDRERRCKHCLRSLSAPARVGRPSWNFLEYNGTELACRDGHGLLTVPEIETSWCRSSTWIPQKLH